MKQLLNIITITKNDYKGVLSTIRSTKKLRSSSQFKQIIVDSSREEIQKQIKTLIKDEPNIDYVWQKSSGISSAFNLGIHKSNAEWVWFLNGGDEVHPDVELDNLLYILKNSAADAIVFQIELMMSGNTMLRPPLWRLWPPVFNWIPHPATITRKALYKQHGDFDESYSIAMDYEFWFRCFSKETVVDTLSIKLSRYDETGISRTQLSKVFEESGRAVKTHYLQMIRIWLINGRQIFKAWRHYHKLSKHYHSKDCQ